MSNEPAARTVSDDAADALQRSRFIGIIEGDSMPDLFIPALVELYMQGRFPFDKLVKFYTLDRINEAAEDSEKGITIKPIIRLTS